MSKSFIVNWSEKKYFLPLFFHLFFSVNVKFFSLVYSPVHKCWPKTSAHGLETRVIIKISTHSCYPRTFDCFMGLSKKIFFWKKSKLASSKQTIFFKTVNSQYFLRWSSPWVRRINWCQEHQCDQRTNPAQFRKKSLTNGFQPMRSWANTYTQDCIYLLREN